MPSSSRKLLFLCGMLGLYGCSFFSKHDAGPSQSEVKTSVGVKKIASKTDDCTTNGTALNLLDATSTDVQAGALDIGSQMSIELTTKLQGAGLTKVQATYIGNMANHIVVATVGSLSVDPGSSPLAVAAPLVVQGAVGALSDSCAALATTDQRSNTIKTVMDSTIESLGTHNGTSLHFSLSGISFVKEVSQNDLITLVGKMAGTAVKALPNAGLTGEATSQALTSVTSGTVGALPKAKLPTESIGKAAQQVASGAVAALATTGATSAQVGALAGNIAAAAIQGLSQAGLTAAQIIQTKAISQIVTGAASSIAAAGASKSDIAASMGAIASAAVSAFQSAGLDSVDLKKSALADVVGGAIAGASSLDLSDSTLIASAMSSVASQTVTALPSLGFSATDIVAATSVIVLSGIENIANIGGVDASAAIEIAGKIIEGAMQGAATLANSGAISSSQTTDLSSSATSNALQAMATLQTAGIVSNASDISSFADSVNQSVTSGLTAGGASTEVVSNVQTTVTSVISNNATVSVAKDTAAAAQTTVPVPDTKPPAVTAVVVQSPLVIMITFSEAMGTGVTDPANYTVSGTGVGTLANHPVSVALVSGNIYTLTWSMGEMINSGDITITVVNAQDLAGNAISSTATHQNGGIGFPPTGNSITINEGSAFSSSNVVDLTLASTDIGSGVSQMYITNSEGCSANGAWEPFATSKSNWTLAGLGAQTVYAKFRDNVGQESDCVSANIYVRSSFSSGWTFDSSTSAQYSFDSSLIDFNSGVCELTPSSTLDSGPTSFGTGAGGGAANGVTYGTLSDGSGGLKLDTSDTPINNSELDASWTPQWASLVSYYKMNEFSWSGTAGEVFDSVGTKHGTAQGTITTTTSAKLGSHAGNFPGSAGFLSMGSTLGNFGTSDFTIGFWIKTTSEYTGMLVTKRDVCSHANFWNLIYVGIVIFEIDQDDGGTNYGSIANSKYLNDGVWHYFNAVRSGTNLYIYVDGILDATGSTQGVTNLSNNANFQIGNISCAGSGDNFIGYLDDVAIWTAALSDTDIKTIYDRQYPSYSGTFTSRVIDAQSITLSGFTWASTLPFFKELPDYSGGIQNESSIIYPSLVGSTGQIGDNDLMSGILGLWHAENNWNDSSGNSNNGTSQGGVTFSTYSKLGSYSGSFDGATSYVDFPNISSDTDVSISGWIFPQSYAASASNSPRVLMNWDGTRDLQIILSESNKFIWGSTTVENGTGTTQVPPLFKWTHFVVTKTGTTYKIYLNGADTSATGTVPTWTTPSVSGMRLGASIKAASFGGNFNGYIDEVAIWSRVLTAGEAKQLYQRGASRNRFQVRTCTTTNCSDQESSLNKGWKGPDGTNRSYFSELNNTTLQLNSTGSVLKTRPNVLFSLFPSLSLPANRYFQYRVIMDTESSTIANGPEIKSVSLPQSYSNANPTIYGINGVSYKTLNTFSVTFGPNGCTTSSTPKFILSADATNWYYWNAGSWVVSNGSISQANNATDVSIFLSAFPNTVSGSTLFVKAFLASDGSHKCEIDSITVTGTN